MVWLLSASCPNMRGSSDLRLPSPPTVAARRKGPEGASARKIVYIVDAEASGCFGQVTVILPPASFGVSKASTLSVMEPEEPGSAETPRPRRANALQRSSLWTPP